MTDDLRDFAQQYSKRRPRRNDLRRRLNKGGKIAAILQEVLEGRSVHHILDVGCSTAAILQEVNSILQPHLALGMDMDAEALPQPTQQLVAFVGDALAIPIATESVDVILCNHIYEHVSDTTQLFAEMKRVLKPGGLIYFGAMNATWPVEPHYHLPFLHWLPNKLSDVVLSTLGHPSGYLERPLPVTRLRNLVSDFDLHDYTLKVIEQPTRYRAEDVVSPRFASLFHLLAKRFYNFLPAYLWVLVKPSQS